MIKRVWIGCLIFFSLSAFSDCFTPDICGAIESIEMVLISDNFSKDDLMEYQSNLKKFITEKEHYYRELQIINPDLDTIQGYMPLLASKMALAECGDSGEVLAGALDGDNCYPCISDQFEDQSIDTLASDVANIERAIIANIAEEKLTESALNQMVSMCDEGDAVNVRACVENQFGKKIPEHIQDKLNQIMRNYRSNAPTRNDEIAGKVNLLLNDLRGGDYCPEAQAITSRPDEGLVISEWTLEDNGLVDLELALEKCSPLKAMALIENLFFLSNHQGWDFAEQEVFNEGINNLWRGQHNRAHKMLTSTIADVGSVALGGRIYDCLGQFPPPEIDTHGSSLDNIYNGGNLLKGKGKCKSFDAGDVQKARDDALGIAAKELKDKNKARRGRPLIGANGNDDKFLAQMAHDNPKILGDILAENLQTGDSCVSHICEALKEASKIERREKTRATIRRIAVTGLAIGSSILAFTPASPGAVAMAGIAAGVGVVSVVSAGIDLASKADQVRSMKFKLMGEQGDVSPAEWSRLKGLESELDMLTVELALEIGLTAFDFVQLIRLAGIRNMDEAVDLARKLKGSTKAQVDELISACK